MGSVSSLAAHASRATRRAVPWEDDSFVRDTGEMEPDVMAGLSNSLPTIAFTESWHTLESMRGLVPMGLGIPGAGSS
jgi:hypothetical protein